jgi:hypothetical protein
MKINLQDIKVGDLNSASILILSKFARVLHEHNGGVIKLQNPNVLLEVANYASSEDNSQLRILYERLKLELRTQLNSSVPNHGDIGGLLIQPNLKARIQRRKKLSSKDQHRM